jgi:hypothetical protein
MTGCQPDKKESKLLGEIVTKNNITDLFKSLREDKDFTTRDFEYFTNGMTRLVTMSVDSLMGKNVGQIISLQENFERDQMAATAANQATKVELVINHEFKYVGMKPSEYDDKDKNKKEINILVYDVTNKSDKEIVDIEGILQFMDQNNQVVKVYPIISNKIMKGEVIKPGETKRIAHPFDHDATNERDMRIRNEHQSLRPIWICTKIEFKDGSKIAVTNTL